MTCIFDNGLKEASAPVQLEKKMSQSNLRNRRARSLYVLFLCDDPLF